MLDRLRGALLALPRPQKRLMQIGFDVVALWLAAYLAYNLRLGFAFTPNALQIVFIGLAPLIALPFFIRMGLYRAILRYLPERAGWTIIQAMTLATIVWVTLIFLFEMTGLEGVPRSVPIIYWALGVLFIGGSRYAAKAFFAVPEAAADAERQALIYGAGRAGSQLAVALRATRDRSVVGFLDDNPALHGQDIAGLRVFAPEDLPRLIEDMAISDVILCLPSAGATRRLEIAAALKAHPVELLTLPSISDIAAGRYSVSQLKEIDVEDLLGRQSVAAEPALLDKVIAGRRILVTGAGGSIGSQLCRLIAGHGPAELVLFEQSEFALYEIERSLRAQAPDLALVPVLGSVTQDAKRLLVGHRIDTVFHAAAYKHVPLVEANVAQGVRNNLLGTRILAEAAYEAGVERFVLISTDKAVRPSSVMGATKRWSELIVRALADRAEAEGTGQRFLTVRFGNVLGSTGSVVPLFREQIARGGPVTVTDGRMTRYFMAVSEAVELIVQSAALSEGGEVFLLDMGEPVPIRTLAANMVSLAGLTVRSPDNPDGDIEIREIGMRPGEKLHETLFYDPAKTLVTAHPKIFKARRVSAVHAELEPLYSDLLEALDEEDAEAARAILFRLIAIDTGEGAPEAWGDDE